MSEEEMNLYPRKIRWEENEVPNTIIINGERFIKYDLLNPSPKDNEFCMSQDKYNEYCSYKQKIDKIRDIIVQMEEIPEEPGIVNPADFYKTYEKCIITRIKLIL